VGSSILKVIVCSVVAFGVVIAGAFVLIDRKPPPDLHQTGTIQIAGPGATCQRLVVDNSTGAIKSRQQVPCGDPPKEGPVAAAPAPPQPPAPQRYSSGGRLEAIRDSFNGK